MSKKFLGIDTSNYTTSVALTDENGIVIADKKQMLTVKKGARGLRQQEAVFQHIKNMPKLFASLCKEIDKNDIKAIGVSSAPRLMEGSYMPVFEAGKSFAHVLGSMLRIPVYEFSHQEGHIKAIAYFNDIDEDFICFHLSGGTTEILKVNKENSQQSKFSTELIGRTLDISIGQLIDRIGVAFGLEFPAGNKMDEAALFGNGANCKSVKPIFITNLDINLSGIETQLLRGRYLYSLEDTANRLFTEITLCLQKLVKECELKFPNMKIVFAGGVSQSSFIRTHLADKVIFGKYGADNAVGISLLGGNAYAFETDKGQPIK